MIEARNAIQASPKDGRGYISLAKTLIKIGRPREAVKHLETLESSDVDYVLTIAEAYLGSGKTRSAANVLEINSGVLANHQAAVNLLLGDIALSKGEPDAAEKRFKEVLAEDESNTDAILGLVRVEIVRNDFAEVERLLDRVLQIDPTSPRGLLFASSLKSRDGDLAGAEDLLRNATSSMSTTDVITPIRYSILVALRDVLTQQGRSSEALIYSGLLAEAMPGVQEVGDKLQAAMNALSTSDFDNARALLAEIQQTAPGSAQAGTMLGVLEYLQGNNDAAVRQFDQFIDPETATPTALQIFALAELRLNQPQKVLDRLKPDIDSSKNAKLVSIYGIAALSTQDAKTGEKYLLKSVELDPTNGRLRLPLVRMYNTQGDDEKALQQMALAFESQPDDALIQAGYVQQLTSSGNVEKAEQVVKAIQSGYPESENTQILAARFHLSQQNPGEAMEILQNVPGLDESIQARHLLASIYLRGKEFAAAENEYRSVIGLDENDLDAYKGLITVYELQGKPEVGITAVKGLAKKSGKDAPRLVLSEYYGRNGDFDQAFSLLDQLVDSTTIEHSRLLLGLYLARANQATRDGDLRRARETILSGLTEIPANSRMLALLVNIEIRADQLGEAERVLKRLQEIEPNSPLVTALGGDIFLAKEDYSLAYERYQLAWQATPTDQIAMKIYATLNRQSNNAAKVIEFFDEWQNKLPGSQLSGLTSAGYYMQNGSLNDARRVYEALLEKFDNLAVAYNNLAWIYGEDELDKAVAAGRKAYEIAPESAEIIDTYAWFLFKNGDKEQARDLLMKAADQAPGNKEIRQHLDEVLE